MLSAETLLPRAIDARLPREPWRNGRVLRDWDRYAAETAVARPGELRVLLLSNSQGRGPEYPSRLTYPALLEARLNEGRTGPRVRIVNWSFAANRLPEAVLLLARAQDLRPHLVLSVFPPNWFKAEDYETERQAVRLTRMESDLTDTAWLYRNRLPPEYVDHYLGPESAVRAALARGWPMYRFRDLPVFLLGFRLPALRPLLPEAVQSPWADVVADKRPRVGPGRSPAFARHQPHPALLRMFSEAAGRLGARRAFAFQPLWYRVHPMHEPVIADLSRTLEANGFLVWDLREAVVWSGFFEDTVHLTAAGHQRFAEVLAERVAPLLDPERAP